MINTDRFEIKGKYPVSSTTIHGRASFLFGIPFAAAGIYIILISLNIIDTPDSKFNVPRNIVAMFGGVFLLPGLFLIVHGLTGMWKKDIKATTPGTPWELDYKWDTHSIKDKVPRQLVKFFFSTVFLILFLLPFHIFIFKYLHGSKIYYFPKILMILFDLAVIAVIGTYFYKLLRYLKYGGGVLRFNQFPYFLGSTIDATYTMNKTMKGTDQINVTLRCLEEKYEIRGSGDNRKSVVVMYHIYSESKTLDIYTSENYGTTQIPIKFDLPDDEKYRTRLSERPPTYWQLELNAETKGIDFNKTFLVPVY